MRNSEAFLILLNLLQEMWRKSLNMLVFIGNIILVHCFECAYQ